MYWRFDEYPPSMVEAEVTQLEQFQNEDLDLPQTLVRESIQNSLDARSSAQEQARIRFAFVSGYPPEPEFLEKLFEGHLEHAKASNVDISEVDFSRPSVLVIEDFATTGLTGAYDSWDEGKFCYFWRHRGKSNKSGTQQGRRGLGKLVFSASSQLCSFFGITIPADSQKPLLMGHTVLKSHRIDDRRYPPDGFFSEVKQFPPEQGLPVPIEDESFIKKFGEQFGLQRENEPGLSIIIPFPVPVLGLEAMITAGILGFFIPILQGQLILEFGNIIINAENVLDVAKEYCEREIPDIDELFAFIREAREKRASSVRPVPGWYRNGRLTGDSFRQEDLEKMKEDFGGSKIIAVCMPIAINRKKGESLESDFFIFLKKPANLSRGQDFYVRNGLNIPGESRFHDRRALGMLLAENEPVAEFLGDAENPAHYRWNGKSGTLRQKYKNPELTLRAIRNSLIGLHDLLSQVAEEPDENALLDFFWIPGKSKGKGKEKVTSKPPPPPSPVPEKYRIDKLSDGFTVRLRRRFLQRPCPSSSR
ncbi:MAG: hypothetical protein QME75_12295 [Deltaproteobacteria bacterium]|nr:hypothetical protein [Deltaproteobacteria bacterium]